MSTSEFYKPPTDGPQDELAERIGQAIGAASTCWSPMARRAEFDSTKAKRIADELIGWVREQNAGWIEKSAELDKRSADGTKIQEQIHRYFLAVYGKDYVYRAPETFENAIERWMLGVAHWNIDFADEVMTLIEAAAKRRNGS